MDFASPAWTPNRFGPKMVSKMVAKNDAAQCLLPRIDKNDPNYGRPIRGSKSESRGIRASKTVMAEIIFLCEQIDDMAVGEPPNRCARFGPLFKIYSIFSGSLVGMLIRARKYGLIAFDGEMLYQGQDDDVIVRLLLPIDQIRKCVRPSGDPVNCVVVVN